MIVMKNVLVAGANGQLGNSIRRKSTLYASTHRFLFTDVDALDLCDPAAVRSFVADNHIHYILNCAAYTAVDKAEDDEALCSLINCDAVRTLGEAAEAVGAKVIHVSTDYVFDGTNHRPYVETDPACPASVYGRTKRAGELALQAACPSAVVIRTSWLYSEYGNNFVKTMLRLGSERSEIRVVFDQVGTPTYAGDLADAMLAILAKDADGLWSAGIYHFSDEGVCSWYDFTVKIMQLAGLPAHILPIESADYPARAARPHYSVLNKAKIKSTYSLSIPHWEASLQHCLQGLITPDAALL